MAERTWVPLESDGKSYGGFCRLLRECLEAAGVGTDGVSYKGRAMGHMEQTPTFLAVTVPADPRVPEFKEVEVHCFESSTTEAHQTGACRALKKVCVQLREKLKDTPFSVLPTEIYDPGRWDTSDRARYLEVTSVEEDKMMLAARRCILAQDQALYWADGEIAYLRWRCDDALRRVRDLEVERERIYLTSWRSRTRGTESWYSLDWQRPQQALRGTPGGSLLWRHG
jgi:hypothetical protein